MTTTISPQDQQAAHLALIHARSAISTARAWKNCQLPKELPDAEARLGEVSRISTLPEPVFTTITTATKVGDIEKALRAVAREVVEYQALKDAAAACLVPFAMGLYGIVQRNAEEWINSFVPLFAAELERFRENAPNAPAVVSGYETEEQLRALMAVNKSAALLTSWTVARLSIGVAVREEGASEGLPLWAFAAPPALSTDRDRFNQEWPALVGQVRAYPTDTRAMPAPELWRHVLVMGMPISLARCGEITARQGRLEALQAAAHALNGNGGNFAQAMQHADNTYKTVAVIPA